MGWQEKAKAWFEYEPLLMTICVIVVSLLSILLAGCTTPNGLSNIYLLSLEYSNSSTPTTADPAQITPFIATEVYNVSQAASGRILQVRAGYRGLCMTPNDGDRVCSSSASTLVDIVKAQRDAAENEAQEMNETRTSNIVTSDPLNIIWIADNFRQTIVFDGLIFITIALSALVILMLLAFPRWHEEMDEDGSARQVKPFPSRRMLVSTMLAAVLGFMFILISGLWQQINSSATASMTKNLTYGAVEGRVGAVAMALSWTAVGFQGIAAVVLLLWALKIKLLAGLLSDE